jgi:hypothetical protein
MPTKRFCRLLVSREWKAGFPLRPRVSHFWHRRGKFRQKWNIVMSYSRPSIAGGTVESLFDKRVIRAIERGDRS